MTMKDIFENDNLNTVSKMLKIKADRDPVFTAIEMLSDEKDIMLFLTDYIDWIKIQHPDVEPIVYTILKINHMLEKKDGVFKNYHSWKSLISLNHLKSIQC